MSKTESMHSTDNERPEAPSDLVLEVTRYERVTSFLLALLFMLGGVSAGFGLMWSSNHWATPTPQARPVDLLEAEEFSEELSGGDVNGALNGGTIEIPGLENGEPAAAEDSDRPTADSIALVEMIADVVGAAKDATELADQLLLDAPTGFVSGSRGNNRSRILGRDRANTIGLAAADRWEIVFERGLTEDEYARQLDSFNVELGVVADGKLYRVSRFSSSQPAVRVTEPRATKHEVMFIWRDERRRHVDLRLIGRAKDVPTADPAVVLHFYPSATALKLRCLELDYAAEHGRPDSNSIAKTRFAPKQTDAVYDFEIVSQRYFAKYEREAKL